MMVTVWIIAFINYAPAIVLWEFVSGRRTVKDGECKAEFHGNLVYLTLTACVEFFVPLISICTLNLAVYLNIRKRSRGLIRSENPFFTIKDGVSSKKEVSNDKTAQTITKQESLQMDQIRVLRETTEKPNDAKIVFDSVKSKSMPNSASNTSGSSEESPPDKKQKSLPLLKDSFTFSLKSKKARATTNKDEEDDKEELGVSLLNENIPKPAIESSKKAVTSQGNSAKIFVSATAKCAGINATKSATTFKKSSSARNTLTKDKKAARSLFILVFVFVFCWVTFLYTFSSKIDCVYKVRFLIEVKIVNIEQ